MNTPYTKIFEEVKAPAPQVPYEPGKLDELLSEANKLDFSETENHLRQTAKPKLTREEYREQKISFLYGELHPKYGISRADAERIADEHS